MHQDDCRAIADKLGCAVSFINPTVSGLADEAKFSVRVGGIRKYWVHADVEFGGQPIDEALELVRGKLLLALRSTKLDVGESYLKQARERLMQAR